jgi:hypothetical protein
MVAVRMRAGQAARGTRSKVISGCGLFPGGVVSRPQWSAFLRKQGFSEFAYGEELDVFRFPKDGSFAFCEEFADWDLLEERGYLD